MVCLEHHWSHLRHRVLYLDFLFGERSVASMIASARARVVLAKGGHFCRSLIISYHLETAFFPAAVCLVYLTTVSTDFQRPLWATLSISKSSSAQVLRHADPWAVPTEVTFQACMFSGSFDSVGYLPFSYAEDLVGSFRASIAGLHHVYQEFLGFPGIGAHIGLFPVWSVLERGMRRETEPSAPSSISCHRAAAVSERLQRVSRMKAMRAMSVAARRFV